MADVILKIAKEKVNAITDDNPDNFSLYVDGIEDLFLGKVKEAKISDVGASSSKTINHGLGYIPFCMVYKLVTGGIWTKVFGMPIDSSGCYFSLDIQNIIVTNTTASPITFKYFIFYDNIHS